MLVHSYNISRVNGPGVRFVLWTQGCTKGCKECYNPETWKFEGQSFSSDEIFELICSYEIDGITLTGGDPLEQEDILDLLRLLWRLNLPKGIILFTGYTFDEINNSHLRECFNYIDVLIDGRFEKEQKISSSLRGSENQNILYFSSKVSAEELNIDHEVEVLRRDGLVSLTGFPKLDRKYLRSLGVIV